MLKCPKCQGKMILLLMSAVCDNCDFKKNREMSCSPHFGWVAVTGDVEVATKHGISCVVFDSEENLHDFCIKHNFTGYDIYKVAAKEPILFYNEKDRFKLYSLSEKGHPEDERDSTPVVRLV